MVLKTWLIGIRVSEKLYTDMHACVGDNMTIGDVIKKPRKILFSRCFKTYYYQVF